MYIKLWDESILYSQFQGIICDHWFIFKQNWYHHQNWIHNQQLVWKLYRQVSNIRRTLVGNKIVDHLDVFGASPVGAALTTSSFST